MEKPSFDLLASYRSSQGLSKIFGHVMIVLMMLSVTIGLSLAAGRVFIEWHGLFLVILGPLVSMEAIYTRKSTADLDPRERIFFRLSEWIAFAVIIKLLLYLVDGGLARLLVDLPLWQQDFVQNFFTGDYVFCLIVIAIVWFSSMAYASEMEALYNLEEDAAWDDLGRLQNMLHDFRNQIASRIFIIGSVVVLTAILTRAGNFDILRTRPTSWWGLNGPILNILFYFILALVTLSQTQFTLMRTRWIWQHLPISANVTKNWLRYGLLFFIALAVIVFFLPTDYSLGLVDTLRYAFSFLAGFFSFLFLLVTLPITLCASLLALITGPNVQNRNLPRPIPPQFPPPATPQPIAWLEFLRSLAFWVIFLSVIFLALRFYLMQNATLWNIITCFPLFRWISNSWRTFWKWLKGANHEISQLVQSGIKRLRAQRVTTPAVIRHVLNFSHMGPRERIIHFYLSLVQLGSERGLERKPAQTPYQYEQRVSGALPEVNEELHRLTDTFIEARYSRHPVEMDKSDLAKTLWERIKAVLTNWRRESR